ncbi:MAG: bifunctional 4-hydroxy-2-oxoglutarate aldolase/2-dehydro-3-deoxy-phosphogluconate aldolase [Bacteroidetes Order II. Incertae sedis bacterium]|nr:bifunctional 4-hydroxy-2-oxoglutarate aldolase/2-dehydro-3-deoxy-phosphogluconate aldolase [Bacteroidetes Order II. bacterium]
MTASELQPNLLRHPVVGTFYSPDTQACCDMMVAAYRGGLRFFELLNRGPEVIETFEALVSVGKAECPQAFLGVGTVMNRLDAVRFIGKGANFVVSPHISAEVGKVCTSSDVYWIPGFLTPTELQTAIDLGANMVKLFPGPTVGTAHLAALRTIWKKIPVMVSGGVPASKEGIDPWMASGANVVAVNMRKICPGSWDSGHFDEMEPFFQDLFLALGVTS